MNRLERGNSSITNFDRLGEIEPFRAMQVVGKANEMIKNGRDIIMMCVGQPSAPAAQSVRDAAVKAASTGIIEYTSADGMQDLRSRIADHYHAKYGVELELPRIIVTTGSSAGFVLAFLSMYKTGDRVAIPSPGYPAYRNILRALSLEPVIIDTSEESGWVLTPEILGAEHRRKKIDGVLVANPNNPNGTMMSGEAFQALLSAARQMDISFISDEIYHGLSYGKPEHSALEFIDDVVIINSFSKYFCMTGWRIGWMIIPPDMVEVVNRLQQNVYICAPQISQIAASAAFDGMDEMETVKEGYRQNSVLVQDRLAHLGIQRIQPIDGAFYAYFDCTPWLEKKGGQGSVELAERILEDTGVALTPGIDFDLKRGQDWIRLSFAGDHERLKEGFARLEDWLNQ